MIGDPGVLEQAERPVFFPGQDIAHRDKREPLFQRKGTDRLILAPGPEITAQQKSARRIQAAQEGQEFRDPFFEYALVPRILRRIGAQGNADDVRLKCTGGLKKFFIPAVRDVPFPLRPLGDAEGRVGPDLQCSPDHPVHIILFTR